MDAAWREKRKYRIVILLPKIGEVRNLQGKVLIENSINEKLLLKLSEQNI